MAAATATRWRRYGKDRLYVQAVDGTALGWCDLQTGEDHVVAPDRAVDFQTAVRSWGSELDGGRRSVGVTRAAEVPQPRAEPAVPPAVVADPPQRQEVSPADDLAGQRPGAMVREQARVLRSQAPVRTLVARIFGVPTHERAYRIGADGEELVGAQLAALVAKDPRWRALHSIPVGEHGSDIDHVVVGPGGVFTLNTKHRPDARVWVRDNAFYVNGCSTPYVRNSRYEAARASRMLTAGCGFPVDVRGLIVPVGMAGLTVKAQPVDVRVVRRRALVGWLRQQPEVLDQATIESVYGVARRATTWTAPPSTRSAAVRQGQRARRSQR